MPSIPTRQLECVHMKSHRDGALDSMTIKMIRQRLEEDHDWSRDDDEWKELKGEIKKWWAQQDLPTTSPASSPVKKPTGKKGTTAKARAKASDDDDEEEKPPSKKTKVKASTKYGRAAAENLNTFVGTVFGASGACGDEDEDEDEEYDDDDAMDDFIEPEEELLGRPDNEDSGSSQDDSDNDVTASEASTPPAKPKSNKFTSRKSSSEASKKKTFKKGSASTSFKSAETIDDSDDSDATPRIRKRAVDSDNEEDGEEEEDKPRKKKKRASEDSSPKTKARSAKDTTKASKKKSTSGQAPKEGDAEKGTDEEEARIKKLKGLVTASGTARPFNASTGAERTLSVKMRMNLLERFLREAGLKCGSGVRGALPSLANAKKVGEERELKREMEELSGAPISTGLRTGKKLPARGADDDTGSDSETEHNSKGKVKVASPKRKFGAFLGDQSSDSD